jgi:hypothetical protein
MFENYYYLLVQFLFTELCGLRSGEPPTNSNSLDIFFEVTKHFFSLTLKGANTDHAKRSRVTG